VFPAVYSFARLPFSRQHGNAEDGSMRAAFFGVHLHGQGMNLAPLMTGIIAAFTGPLYLKG
jgi:hypothetical protein